MRKRSQYESHGWHFALATVYIVHCFVLLQLHPQSILGAGSVICTVHSSKHRALIAGNQSRSGKRRGARKNDSTATAQGARAVLQNGHTEGRGQYDYMCININTNSPREAVALRHRHRDDLRYCAERNWSQGTSSTGRHGRKTRDGSNVANSLFTSAQIGTSPICGSMAGRRRCASRSTSLSASPSPSSSSCYSR